jgi:3,4-dihydroxy 2-butanone 4-phosphate synthase/GTP cyclohydrolase II
MARHARGLICLALTREHCERLRLPLMVNDTNAKRTTNFTVSIEAAHGVTTGISAADRAHTVRVAVAPECKREDLVMPGHIFPLMAQPGGVLVRAGHTEAGCDLARLAGLTPAAVIVEILKDDGSMARRPDLERFAQEHGLRIGTVADLIQYRLLHENSIERVAECTLPTEHGAFRLLAYMDRVDERLHLALVRGEVDPDQPTLVRVHLRDTLCDVLGGRLEDCHLPLADAMRSIAQNGNGVAVVLQHPEPPSSLVRRMRDYQLQERGVYLPRQDRAAELRVIGVGAQILSDLGVRRMRVLGQPRRLHALSGFGLEVVEYVTEI